MNIENLKWQELVLTPEELEFFLEFLDRPPAPPSEREIELVKEYREMIRTGALTVVD